MSTDACYNSLLAEKLSEDAKRALDELANEVDAFLARTEMKKVRFCEKAKFSTSMLHNITHGNPVSGAAYDALESVFEIDVSKVRPWQLAGSIGCRKGISINHTVAPIEDRALLLDLIARRGYTNVEISDTVDHIGEAPIGRFMRGVTMDRQQCEQIAAAIPKMLVGSVAVQEYDDRIRKTRRGEARRMLGDLLDQCAKKKIVLSKHEEFVKTADWKPREPKLKAVPNNKKPDPPTGTTSPSLPPPVAKEEGEGGFGLTSLIIRIVTEHPKIRAFIESVAEPVAMSVFSKFFRS